jgi:hypothetical protein
MKKRLYLSFLIILLIATAGSAHYCQRRFHRHKGFTSASDCIIALHLNPHKTAVPNPGILISPVPRKVVLLRTYKFPAIVLSVGYSDIIRPPPIG